MDPDEPGPTALCVTDSFARDAHRWASDVPGRDNMPQVQAAYLEAKAWCGRCNVASQCLTFALAEEGRTEQWSRDGIYGGKDPAQRARLAGVTNKTKERVA